MDKRTEKSKAAIKKALAGLIAEDGFDKVTVSKLAIRADINRKTFYNCYADIYEVIDEIENDMVDQFMSQLNDLDFRSGVPDPMKIYEKVSFFMNRDSVLYGVLMDKNNEMLTKKLEFSLVDRTANQLCEIYRMDESRARTVSTVLVTGLFSAFLKWVADGKRERIDEIAGVVSRMISGALAAVMV